MSEPEILAEVRDGIGWINLNRGKALNALSLNMIHTLQDLLNSWYCDEKVNAIVVQSKDQKAFCAGGDIRWLYQQGLAQSDKQLDFFWHEYRLNHAIANYPKPYISLLNGITMGGGVGISLHGSHPIATEHFQFAMPETGIGFFPDIGGGYLLSRCHGRIGYYLGLCGSRIDANQALDAGLIRHVIASDSIDRLLAELMAINWEKTKNRVDKHAEVGRIINQFTLEQSPSTLRAEYDQIDQCFNYDQISAIIDALKDCGNDWSERVLDSLLHKSPTSLCLTLEQLHRAQTSTLDECLKMEFRMVTHLMSQADFYEGVRALIVDKDKNPRWNPSTVNEVEPEQIQAYFTLQARELNFN